MKCDNGVIAPSNGCDLEANFHGKDIGTGMVLNFCKGHAPRTEVEWRVLFRGLVEAAARRGSVQVKGEEVVNPRAAMEKVALALESTPAASYVPKTLEERRTLLRLDHENAVANALFVSRRMVKNVQEGRTCKDDPKCFPGCMLQPYQSDWISVDAALRREEELRTKLKELA